MKTPPSNLEVPLDASPEHLDAVLKARRQYEDAFLVDDPEAIDSRQVDRLWGAWQRARTRAFRAVRSVAAAVKTTARALTPQAVAFLREMGRMAADLHWREASDEKR
jgi:hypothetical protein